jgi:hypothetical protein
MWFITKHASTLKKAVKLDFSNLESMAVVTKKQFVISAAGYAFC